MVADNSEQNRESYQPIHDYSHPSVNNEQQTTRPNSNRDVDAPNATTTSTEEFRPLNVKDALTYLDKVKAKFSTQTDVYNQFLDIMKDFKSQMIDTPGVIERVSTLFRGHPVLISGFNTFLPPGYRIECSVDEQERNIIKVTTPSGTTSIADSEALNLRGGEDGRNISNNVDERNKAPIEFNHAITYVNKIKSNFASQPEIYKKFLEILQTYQKDQKPIQEVYAEVQVLFKGSNELLDEFKQFLPEPKQRKRRSGNISTLGISKRTKHHHKTDVQTSDVRSQASSAANNKEDESALSTPLHSTSDDLARPTFSAEEAEFFEKVKAYIGNKATYNAFLKVLNLFSQQIVDQNILVSRVQSFIGGSKELFDWFKTLVGYDSATDTENFPSSQYHPTTYPHSTRSNDTATTCGPSYRHVPKAWQNRTCSGRDALCWDVLNDTYISHPTWASEDTGFVASKKNQYEEALHRVEEERYDYDLNIEANLNTIALLEPIAKKISIMTLPEEKANFKLSPGLGSPSRTIYERIIKKIYGVQKGPEIIELLHNNPSQTVPIVLKRLKQKDDEWKRAQREWNKIWREVEQKNYWKSLDYQGIDFKMKDRKAMTTRVLVSQAEKARTEQQLNTTTEQAEEEKEEEENGGKESPHFSFEFKDLTVFKDVSRLVYFFLERQPVYNPEDCETMLEFMNTMVPLFFHVKDVEPSVDVAGGMTEAMMEDADDDASSVQSVESDPALPSNTNAKKGMRTSSRPKRTRGSAQDDDKLLKGVLKRNMNKKQSSSDDEENTTDNNNDSSTDDDNDEDEDEDEEEEDEEEEEEEVTRKVEIKKEAIKESTRQQRSKGRRGDGVATRVSKATPSNRKVTKTSQRLLDLDSDKVGKTPTSLPNNIKAERAVSIDLEQMRKVYNLFGDNGFYCFFRLYQALYERLCKMKTLDMEFKKHPEKAKKASEEAHELGITPRRFKALKMDTKRGYYNTLLSLIDKLFEGKVDQPTYEECVRYIFGSGAYIMFTVNKLVLSLVRHIHIIVADTQSQELYDLFNKEYRAEQANQGDLVTYRTRVAGIIDSMENTYHINFKVKSQTLCICLLNGNTISSQAEGGYGGYDEYVANYIDWANETKGVDQTLLTSRFLKRNLKYKSHQGKDISVRSGMQYKICRDTYHMFYIIGTEDAFVRRGLKPLTSSSLDSKWKKWLDSNWSKGIEDAEKDQAEKEALSLFKL